MPQLKQKQVFKGNKNGHKKSGQALRNMSFVLRAILIIFQERFRSITKSYYRNSVGVVLAYDITNHDSFAHIPVWMQEAKKHIEPYKAVFVLVSCHFRP